ncbi:hypothetical protein B0J14DRAFT_597331 [Halenospora varia]|nr:hypothetical protein B0J14DRAFT_597331 [Halenospora varia]
MAKPVEGAHDQPFNSPLTLSDFVHDFAILSDPPVESSPPSGPNHDLFLESTTGVGTSTPSNETSSNGADYPTRSSPDFFLPLSPSTGSHEQSSQIESHNANLPIECLTKLSPNTKPLQYVRICSSLRDITSGKEKRRATRKRSTKSARSSTRLVRDDAIAFFIENCQSICSGWERLLDRTDQPDNGCDMTESIISAFDDLHDLKKSRGTIWVLTRFAYVHLTQVVDASKAIAAERRMHGHISRGVGKSDASIAIDTYLNARQDTVLSRDQLSEYFRIGRRWTEISRPAPIILAILSDNAETIIKNNSIKVPTLQALAAEIQRVHSEIFSIFTSLDEIVKSGHGSSTNCSVRQMQDVLSNIRTILLAQMVRPNPPLGPY